MKMEEAGDDKDDSKRRTRNLSEKKRRDQFNMLVNELSSMVSSSTRKMDKSSILKSTISFLKNHNEITVRSRAYDVQEDWKPPFLANDEFTYLLMDALEGFLMVLSATGRILYVSDSITALLGHNPAYLANTNLFDLTHPNDKSNLFELLQGYMHSTDPSQSISKDNEVRIEIHLKRGTLDFGTETSYELVTFNGHFRENVDQFANGGSQQNNMHDTRVLFICTGRLHTPHLIRDVSLVNFDRNEFTSRHSLEWKFLFLDHRAPPIIGYLPFEVLGTSGYDYYHFDDLEKVVACHEALMENGEVTSGYYRFLTKGQQWIWLQTRYFITYHQWNSKPEFVVCTHRVVSIADVEKSTKEGAEGSNAIELDSNGAFLKEASEDVMSNVSPSFISEGSSVFASSYQTPSEGDVSLRKIKDAPPDEVTMKTTSPSRVPQCNSSQQSMRDGHSDDAVTSFMSESGDPYSNAYRAQSKARSVKSTTSAGTGDGTGSWGRNSRPPFGSDSGSLSGESSRTSSRRVTKEKKVHQVACFEHCNVVMYQQAHKIGASPLVPQHGIGAQFLDPAPYVGVGVVPLSTLPVIVAQNPADVQEQLQKKHEELQGMIERQQAELQQVKEQLLLARLGVIQPILNVQYVNAEEVQIDIAASALPQIAYPVANQPHLPLPSAPSHLCNPQ